MKLGKKTEDEAQEENNITMDENDVVLFFWAISKASPEANLNILKISGVSSRFILYDKKGTGRS
jgi:hypothetical protein